MTGSCWHVITLQVFEWPQVANQLASKASVSLCLKDQKIIIIISQKLRNMKFFAVLLFRLCILKIVFFEMTDHVLIVIIFKSPNPDVQ